MAPSIAEGSVLAGRVRLVQPLGEGGMGSVWVAEHLTLKSNVAVKVIAARHARSPELVERFEREAATAARIKNPHVVEIHDHGTTEDGQPYIVMELLGGETLESRLRGGRLELAMVREVFEQTCRALGAAHALGVVHRDLKPANIFLAEVSGYETFVKVLDFGIAKDPASDSGATATGAFLGTLNYMSPEQLESPKDVGASADVWSLAVIAYEMLTGRRPFEAESLPKLSLRIARAEFAPPSVARPGLPRAADDWFERALRQRPEERFSSLDETRRSFLAMLASIPDDSAATQLAAPAPLANAASSAGSDAGDRAPGVLASATSTPLRAWGWVGLGVAVIAGVGAWSMRREPGSPVASTADPAPIGSPPASVEPPGSAAAPESAERPSDLAAGQAQWRRIAQATIRKHRDAFIRCYSDEDAAGRPFIRTLAFHALTDGRVDKVALVEESHRAPRFDRCLVETVRGLRFPAPDHTADVEYPFTFTDETPLDDVACGESAACADRGECSAYEGKCIAKVDSDCRAARVCAQQGLCTAFEHRCSAPRADCGPSSSACKHSGLCEAGGKCVATDETCARATACERFGLCRAQDGVCVPGDDQSCQRSYACQSSGRCSARTSHCVATADADCRSHRACRVDGACVALAGRCVARADADCRSSEVCAESGDCSAMMNGACGAARDEDCASSKACKVEGRCTARDGDCRAP